MRVRKEAYLICHHLSLRRVCTIGVGGVPSIQDTLWNKMKDTVHLWSYSKNLCCFCMSSSEALPTLLYIIQPWKIWCLPLEHSSGMLTTLNWNGRSSRLYDGSSCLCGHHMALFPSPCSFLELKESVQNTGNTGCCSFYESPLSLTQKVHKSLACMKMWQANY